MAGKKWTSEEEALLKRLFPDRPTKEVANELQRSYGSVAQHAVKIGLEKSEAYKKSELSGKYTPGLKSGQSFQFPKGHKPWNKGIAYNAGGRSTETRFKKGQPFKGKDFYIVRDKNGKDYKYVRTAPGKRRPLHQVVWEQEFGPIPHGYMVVFIDGDTMNCVISNLRLISKAENMERNTIQRFPEELKKTIKTLAKLKRKIYEKQN